MPPSLRTIGSFAREIGGENLGKPRPTTGQDGGRIPVLNLARQQNCMAAFDVLDSSHVMVRFIS